MRAAKMLRQKGAVMTRIGAIGRLLSLYLVSLPTMDRCHASWPLRRNKPLHKVYVKGEASADTCRLGSTLGLFAFGLLVSKRRVFTRPGLLCW
jgi:hypothetical protein